MTKLLFALILLFCSFLCFAQLSEGGEPLSFNKNLDESLKKNIKTISMPMVDVSKLKAEDIINDRKKDQPWRFGENINTSIDVLTNSEKDILPDGSALYRLRIYSAGAISLNFNFDEFNIPAGAKLFLYSEDKSSVIGAFTNYNNNKFRVLATTLVSGESVIVEYYEPYWAAFHGSIHLNRVTHGYRSSHDYLKGFGGAGSCNNNVLCSSFSSWSDQIRSVAMIVVNGNGHCSGALVNNTSSNGKPYFLTANHCSSSNNFSSWVFWFNYQSPICANPTSSPSYSSMSGCSLVARNQASDVLLVLLNNKPPEYYNVYYSGWDARGYITPNSACIHHPSGDIKKISLSSDSTVDESYLGINTWRAFWSTGVTESGSSGSPLFDKNKRIVGQLYGGPSSCSATGADRSDYYGKFSVSWNAGVTVQARLKEWLDSAGTGELFIDGYDPPSTGPDASIAEILNVENNYCSLQNISPRVVIKNNSSSNLYSLNVEYKIDNVLKDSYSWSGNLMPAATDTVTFLPNSYTGGTHTIKAYCFSPNSVSDSYTGNDTAVFSFNMLGAGMPFSEDFESTLSTYVIVNPDNDIAWKRDGVYGSSSLNHFAFLNTFNLSQNNLVDEITFPDLYLGNSFHSLTFSTAARQMNLSSSDTLKIFVSTDCGATYAATPIWQKNTSQISTGQAQTSEFFPQNGSDWKHDTISLENFIGQRLRIKFTAVSGGGNNLFLDNVRANFRTKISSFNSDSGVILYPNPASAFLKIQCSASGEKTVNIYNSAGMIVNSINTKDREYLLNLKNFNSGIYFIVIHGINEIYTEKVVINKAE